MVVILFFFLRNKKFLFVFLALIGANASEEADGQDDAADEIRIVPNFVSSNKLEEVPSIGSKNDYKTQIKKIVNKIVAKVKETDPDRAQFLKDNVLALFVSKMLKDYKKLSFYATEDDGFDLEGCFLGHFESGHTDDQNGPKVGEPCYMYVLKDALEAESC